MAGCWFAAGCRWFRGMPRMLGSQLEKMHLPDRRSPFSHTLSAKIPSRNACLAAPAPWRQCTHRRTAGRCCQVERPDQPLDRSQTRPEGAGQPLADIPEGAQLARNTPLQATQNFGHADGHQGSVGWLKLSPRGVNIHVVPWFVPVKATESPKTCPKHSKIWTRTLPMDPDPIAKKPGILVKMSVSA